MDELTKLLQAQGEAFDEFKKANNAKLAEIEENGKATSEAVAKVDTITESLTEIRGQIEDLEAKATAPLREQMDGKTDVERAHIKAFEAYLRNPGDVRTVQELNDAASAFHQKDVTITGTGGGNAIPTDVSSRIEAKVKDLSPFRSIARVDSVSNENFKFPVTGKESTSGWAAAGGTRSSTETPLVNAVALSYGTCYAYPTVQEEALNDLEWDVLSWLEDVVATDLAIAEGAAFISGNGTAKPTGLLNGTPVSTGDEDSPARAFGTLQYVASGAAGAFPNDMTGSPQGDPAAPLFSLVYGVKRQYRQNACFVMNRTTLSTVMQFRDADGNYLFRPSSTAGVPDTLMGYAAKEMEDMPAIGANTFPIAFGDFTRGYQIGDIVRSLRITMDDNITAPGFVKFYARRRVGGKVLNDDAVKVLKMAAS